jgi:hypothetical protein
VAMTTLNLYLPDCTFQHICHTPWVHKSRCKVTWVTKFWMVVHNIFGYSWYGICLMLPIHHLEFLRWPPNFWKICAPLPSVFHMLFGSIFYRDKLLFLKLYFFIWRGNLFFQILIHLYHIMNDYGYLCCK